MAIPHIMPLGFIHRRTEAGAIIMLNNPQESQTLKLGTPITLWRYSPGRLAIAKVRGTVSAVGYVTATFTTADAQIDPRWPADQEIIRPRVPVTFGLDSHEAAVSDEEFENIEQMIVARTHTSGPTRCNSSINILSGKVKCGFCKLAGHDSNLVIHRDTPGGIARLRCSRKKNHGKGKCPSKPIRMDELVNQVLERLLGTIVTEPALRQLIEDVARDSHLYLEEGQERKKELSNQLSEVRKRIRNISDVIQTQGTQHRGLATLLQDLAELEEKERTLQESIQEINDATEQARLFINDPDGILEAVLDLRTYTETRDEQAAKELISLFIIAVYVYKENLDEDDDREKHMEMHWTIPIFSEATGEYSNREIVILANGQDDDQDDNFCLLGTRIGIDLSPSGRIIAGFGFPRPRGDRPSKIAGLSSFSQVPPPTRG